MMAMAMTPAGTNTIAQLIGEQAIDKLPLQAGVPTSPQGTAYICDSTDITVSSMVNILGRYCTALMM